MRQEYLPSPSISQGFRPFDPLVRKSRGPTCGFSPPKTSTKVKGNVSSTKDSITSGRYRYTLSGPRVGTQDAAAIRCIQQGSSRKGFGFGNFSGQTSLGSSSSMLRLRKRIRHALTPSYFCSYQSMAPRFYLPHAPGVSPGTTSSKTPCTLCAVLPDLSVQPEMTATICAATLALALPSSPESYCLVRMLAEGVQKCTGGLADMPQAKEKLPQKEMLLHSSVPSIPGSRDTGFANARVCVAPS